MVLKITNLKARRGGFQLYVERLEVNSVVALVGRNGSGKTTLLDAVAGLIPAEGAVEACGREVSALPPEERKLVYIQATPVDLPMKPRRFLRLVASKWGKGEWEVKEVVERLGIGNLLNSSGLSTGQKQLLNIAAGLLAEPCAFLMDEPTSHLDWFNKRIVNDVVKKIGVPVLYVTHDPFEAFYVGDVICLIEGGRIRGCRENTPADFSEVERIVKSLYL
ncbi:ATP-binding cassette domain-containing protein [Pyrobaculum aerophilum]|uniref:ABC transporter ATP-binding protein, putative n=2 Tax=Pyrobaculum aerophilum TaxID=13773 RepID=Q8ZSV0_PYRAE|nr:MULTISPECIES: ABC transporter ATP-binding protein [Pyrobaculum]AAL65013.1 ABC transporter ATP-binding protein, putative [Pyrobaculum aerophilum str. IM2]MCX8137107.1 ABC transporter ATP-binding protein [Pyrobaculum aerophilum]HII47867.1 ABC transporter ATP-binding protein [Pyrobaculum aerophilum]